MSKRATRSRSNPAIRAEPRGIGTARARDKLSREVELLGALLGQVIVEQEGLAALELVERVRKGTIAGRRVGRHEADRQRLASDLDAVGLRDAETLIRAFQMTNLAEEKQRIRRLRQRQRASRRGLVDESIAAAVAGMRTRGRSVADLQGLVGRLLIAPVLTAHPTEARRRTVLVALRRVYRLLDHLDDPRLTPAEDADVRRQLREEITILWHTSPIRDSSIGPLDEVRSAMALFDESLFVVTPRVYRSLERALGGSRVPAFLAWGSWIGGDRDGNPEVTAQTTREAVTIQSEHVLRAYENVCHRLASTITARMPPGAVIGSRLEADARDLPALAADLRPRFPNEPFRHRFTYMAERLRRTRAGSPGGYSGPSDRAAELDEITDALTDAGLQRVAQGAIQDLRWQLDTFGFHGLSLEVRQHREVHTQVLAATSADEEVSPGVSAGEVLDTFRAMAEVQARFGTDACNRYIVSFTLSAADVLAVLHLARRACGAKVPALDVVPLFESAAALGDCRRIVEELLAHPEYRAHLASRRMQQEVMLGYSDSTKESGSLAAAWMLHRAEQQLVAAARRHAVQLTVFHGRGGAIGRGGGPMMRAILGQAPGSIDGRLKLTEQGEVISDRYANPAIAQRYLEQLTHATLVGSTEGQEASARRAAARGRVVLDELSSTARVAYRALVWEDSDFAEFFTAAMPIAELADMRIGSRPPARRRRSQDRVDKSVDLEGVRAIPWVFAWSQSRANVPGWYGTGAALAEYRTRHRSAGLRTLRQLYRSWPFFASVLDNTEMVLAKADMSIAERYASLAGAGGERIWLRIRDEYLRAVEQILDISQRQRLLDDLPVLQRSIELRNPYVDSLSELQVRLLAQLRRLPATHPSRAELLRLVHLTVSGVAAGLQNTG